MKHGIHVCNPCVFPPIGGPNFHFTWPWKQSPFSPLHPPFTPPPGPINIPTARYCPDHPECVACCLAQGAIDWVDGLRAPTRSGLLGSAPNLLPPKVESGPWARPPAPPWPRRTRTWFRPGPRRLALGACPMTPRRLPRLRVDEPFATVCLCWPGLTQYELTPSWPQLSFFFYFPKGQVTI